MGKIQVGERVWVTDTTAQGGRAFGRIASLSTGFLSGEGDLSFVVLLDAGTTVVPCCEDRRGTQWDFAEEEGESHRAGSF
jgi:hypothetical protein